MARLHPLLLLLLPLLCTCDGAQTGVAELVEERHELSGEAMGTYYRVTYLGDSIRGLQHSVDSLLDAYNLELSAWVPDSKLSEFNRSAEGVDLDRTRHFIPNLELAKRISKETGGAYDPTIAPLVKYWGFGTGKRRETAEYDPEEVAQLKALIGLEYIAVENGRLIKLKPGVQLDMNASAKGYAVDLISQLVEDLGHPNHLIDIGGEMRGGGSKNGLPWNVAIRLPDEDATKITSAGTVPLRDGRALASSGNYLSYYKVDGETFSHTINPITGLVERNRLLGASVLAPDCATADAYATACMVLGPEKALALIESRPELEGYFLIRGEAGDLITRKTSGL